MSFIRPAGAVAILLILLILSAGCGQRVPTRNTTKAFNTTPRPTIGTTVNRTVVPTTTSPFFPATILPTATSTPGSYRQPPPATDLTSNQTLIDEKTLVFVYNRTAYTYDLQNPPLIIEYTLTVPNITKTRVVSDPTTGADTTITITYPDPAATFQVSVKDLNSQKIVAKTGYGGQYDVAYSKRVWVRTPGEYYIEFFGNLVTADVKFWTYNTT